jgi:hypothetical protein
MRRWFRVIRVVLRVGRWLARNLLRSRKRRAVPEWGSMMEEVQVVDAEAPPHVSAVLPHFDGSAAWEFKTDRQVEAGSSAGTTLSEPRVPVQWTKRREDSQVLRTPAPPATGGVPERAAPMFPSRKAAPSPGPAFPPGHAVAAAVPVRWNEADSVGRRICAEYEATRQVTSTKAAWNTQRKEVPGGHPVPDHLPNRMADQVPASLPERKEEASGRRPFWERASEVVSTKSGDPRWPELEPGPLTVPLPAEVARTRVTSPARGRSDFFYPEQMPLPDVEPAQFPASAHSAIGQPGFCRAAPPPRMTANPFQSITSDLPGQSSYPVTDAVWPELPRSRSQEESCSSGSREATARRERAEREQRGY